MKLFIIILSLMIASPAFARIGSVPNAAVNKGVWRLNWRNQYNMDDEKKSLDNRLRSRVGLDYGFTNNYAWLLILQGQNLQGQSPELSNVFFDQRFEGATSKNDGYYSGLRIRYEARLVANQADVSHVRLILGKEIGAWDLRFNQILGMEVGAHRKGGAIIDTRFHVSYMYHEQQRIGLESFSNLGNIATLHGYSQQSHTIGPTFFGALTEKINYDIGYMVGVSKAAPDHSFYFGFSRDF